MLKRDGGYALAYTGLGKAALTEGEYSKALDYFKTSYDRDDYDKAFKYAREEFLRKHFTAIMVVIIVLIVALIAFNILRRHGVQKFLRTIIKGGD